MENNAAKINHTHLTPEKEHNNKRKASRNNVIALLKCIIKPLLRVASFIDSH